jgi:flagellar biogenesis protein FliO
MADNTNYGKKGAYFLGFLGFVLLIVILLIWVYSKNSEFLPIK